MLQTQGNGNSHLSQISHFIGIHFWVGYSVDSFRLHKKQIDCQLSGDSISSKIPLKANLSISVWLNHILPVS